MMFNELEKINSCPEPFQFYSIKELWTDEYTSQQMLKYHLDESVDRSSRNFEFIDRSVEWIMDHFKVNERTRIADFGCGPGLYASRLAKAGAHVTGIDFSKRSIEYARNFAIENGLDIDYVIDDYLEFQPDTNFDLIIMIMCDYCALSPEQRKRLLKKFKYILEEGGSLLLDVYSMKGFEQRQELSSCEKNSLNHFWSPNDYYGFLNVFKYWDEKVVLDKHTIIEKGSTRTIYNWLQYFSKESVLKEFTENGFKIDCFFSNVAGDPYDQDSSEFAIVARKG